MSPAHMPALGEVVAGRYRLDAVLGKGAMGTVFKAEHVNMAKTVALKMLALREADDDALRRFRLEAKLASQLTHPNIVNITDFDVENNRPFIVMDYLRGQSLDRALRNGGTLPLDRFQHLMTQACRALAYAHKRGLVHRDIKLNNLMIVERGGEKDVLMVVDFGLADVMVGDTAIGDTSGRTAVGSPYYMSPEQCRGEKADHRSDIYGLGCVMYRCLTGVTPFTGTNIREMFYKHSHEPPPSFNDANVLNKVPPALEAVVMKALAKEPADRHSDMNELADEISNALAKKRSVLDEVNAKDLSRASSLLNTMQIRKFKYDTSHKSLYAGVGAAIVVVFGVIYWMFARPQPQAAQSAAPVAVAAPKGHHK